MSLEQIILLIAFFIAMVVRAVKQAGSEAREQAQRAASPITDAGDVGTTLAERSPAAPRPRAGYREAPRPRAGYREAPRPRAGYREAPRAEPSKLTAPRRHGAIRLQLGDVKALRRALVLATVLGPPRALKSGTTLDARER